MEELGIIINQYGEEMSFGKWKIRELRDDNNPEDWRTPIVLWKQYTPLLGFKA